LDREGTGIVQHWWESLVFLVNVYWPFLLGAAGIGLVTGWLSLSRPAPRGEE